MPPEDFGAQMLDPREIMILNQLISDADFFAMTSGRQICAGQTRRLRFTGALLFVHEP